MVSAKPAQHQRFPLNAVLKRKDSLVKAGQSFVGQKLEREVFDSFVHDIWQTLPEAVCRTVCWDSVRGLVGSTLSADVLEQTAWRLAGNLEELKSRKPVPVWARQALPTWSPAEIESVKARPGGRRKRQPGYELSFRLLSGFCCGLVATQWWSSKKFSFLARYKNTKGHSFGFTRPTRQSLTALPSKWPYHHPMQFVGLRCLVLIDPSLCIEGPGFHEIDFVSVTSTWNRKIHQSRARIDKDHVCPHGLGSSAQQPCHSCPIGKRSCPMAVHPQTWTLKECRRCNQTHWHDPVEDGGKVCRGCFYKQFYQGDY